MILLWMFTKQKSISLLLLVNVRTVVLGLREWYGSLAASANLTQMYLQFKKSTESPNAKNSTTKHANNYQACANVWVCEPVGVRVHAHSKSTPTWTAINHSGRFIPGLWGCIQRINIWFWSALNDIKKNKIIVFLEGGDPWQLHNRFSLLWC